MPPLIEETIEVPKIVSQVMDTPVPQVVEEFTEVFKLFFQNRIQQRILEQTTETPAVFLAEDIVEALKVQTQYQVLASQTVQKTVEMPQIQFLDRMVDVPVVTQRRVPRPSMPKSRSASLKRPTFLFHT